MPKHVAIEKPQIGELAPIVARHLSYHRALAIDYFIVRKRQDEVLGKGVHQAEGNLALMIAAVDGIFRHVFERVVHPTHIPLEPEPEPTKPRGFGYHWPRSRFLGNGHNVRVLRIDALVENPQELDGFEVLSPAETIRDPTARLLAVIQIQHGRNGIDAQTIDVILIEPEQGIAQQEIAHFAPPVVEEESVPVRLESLARIGMLVQVRPVEIAEAVLIGGKM